MDPTSTILRAARMAGRPAVLAIVVTALLTATAFGTGSFRVREAAAQPILEADGACEPQAVRPGEPVLITCTVTLANTGDETATDLMATVGPASGCDIPFPTFIDLTLNGELLPTGPLQLTYELGDLDGGGVLEAVIRLGVVNYSTGRAGGSITVVSRDDPSVTAGGERCWDVVDDAEAPPSNLQVTKTPLTAFDPPPSEPFPEPPPPPADSVPVPIEPVRPVNPDQAEFEIAISNVSDLEMTDITVLDMQTGGAVLVRSDPPTTSTDALGRAIWQLGTMAPGEEITISAAYGPPTEGNCTYADGLVLVNATPAGGSPEDYVTLPGGSIPIGPCGFGDLCWHYPPDGDPSIAPCDEEVCWAASPLDGDLQPVYGDCNLEHCWYVPPGEGEAALRPCAEDVCWLSYGPDGFGEYFFDVPCDVGLCEYTAPDGSRSFRDSCEYPMCWTNPPGNGEWSPAWGCGETDDLCWFVPPGEGEAVLRPCGQDICWKSLWGDTYLFDVPCDIGFCEFTAPDGTTTTRQECEYPVCWSARPGDGLWAPVHGCGKFEEMCWFSPPGVHGQSQLRSCDYEVRFAVNPPEGAVDFGLGPWEVYFDEDACWPVPPDGGQFFTYPAPCDEVEFVTWFRPPNDGPAFPSYGEDEACWQPLPPDVDLDPGVELPPDLLIPGWCEEGDEPKTGVPGSSVPAEVVETVGTPAEIVEGTVAPVESLSSESVTPAEIVPGSVEQIDPLASADVIPADLIRPERVEPAPPDGTLPVYGPETPSPRDDQEAVKPLTLPELLGFPQEETRPEVGSLPGSGTGPAPSVAGSPGSGLLAATLAAGGLLLISMAARFGQRRIL